jgi:photosystem II stability/assembly factor-like uncharacterized protein
MQSSYPGRLRELAFGSAFGALLLCGASQAQEANADQAIEIIRSGIPHDALFALDMRGEQGLAVGNFGLMLETTDGGAVWNVLPAKTSLALLGVKQVGDRGIAVGQQGLVLTRSGASEWQDAKSGLTQRLLNVDMNESGLAIAVGEFGFVARSRDHGATWEATPLDWTAYNDEGYEPHLYDATVSAEGTVLICGEFGLILRSEDGGDTWTAVNRGDESVFALHLATDGSNTGYAVGQEGLVTKTADGGLTWAKVSVPTNANLLGVWSGNSEVVAVGIRQLLRSSDDGATFTPTEDLNIVRTWFQGVAAGVAESKAGEKGFLRQQSVYIAGHRGTIARVIK